MKYAATYAIVVGLLMILQWIFFLGSGSVPELQSEPWSIGAHMLAELLTALALLISGMAILWSSRWGAKLLLVSLGMVIYSEINSPGYFAQSGQWGLVLMFAILLVGAVAAVIFVKNGEAA